jgi:catechol 2,3-dioxygenase-like lactoylglutathione lyase family enzyme
MDLSNARLVANIPAQDIERAMRWYQEKLGLRPTMDLGVAGQLYQSGGVYWLIYQTSAAGTGKHTVASWVVPSIDDAMSDMRSKGVVFEDYDMGEQGPDDRERRRPWARRRSVRVVHGLGGQHPRAHGTATRDGSPGLVRVTARMGLAPGPRRTHHLFEARPLRPPMEHVRGAGR